MDELAEDLGRIDEGLRLIDREIWVVTGAEGERRGGLVATWVSAASIDSQRPVLLAGLAPNHFTTELVQASKALAAHLLRADQSELAFNFAHGSGRDRDKFSGLAVTQEKTGAPILADCLAWFDCRVFARHDAGDRLFFWADIVAGTLRVPSQPSDAGLSPLPLREKQFFQNLNDEQRRFLIAAKSADAAHNRDFHESWRLRNPW